MCIRDSQCTLLLHKPISVLLFLFLLSLSLCLSLLFSFYKFFCTCMVLLLCCSCCHSDASPSALHFACAPVLAPTTACCLARPPSCAYACARSYCTFMLLHIYWLCTCVCVCVPFMCAYVSRGYHVFLVVACYMCVCVSLSESLV